MNSFKNYSPSSFLKDLSAGLVIFLVALPLCLGIALASDASMMSGLIAGIIGGLVVGVLSGSHISVSGPAAGLTAVVAAQIVGLGSFEAFLAAVVLAGVIQLLLGVLKAGFVSSFFPSSVIKGLLCAIGVILILKQIPHLLGHDPDAFGEMSFIQPDEQNTFTELVAMIGNLHHAAFGAIIVGVVSLLILLGWDRTPAKKLPIPSALVVVLVGGLLTYLFRQMGGSLLIDSSHLVSVPIPQNRDELMGMLTHPNAAAFLRPDVMMASITIAVVASLETLLNIEAADNLDPMQRTTPPNRELFAQGAGNVVSGLLGGLPMTSVVVRSSVNAASGSKTKVAAILHGLFLIGSILLIPGLLNMIPLAALAAILIVIGFKLASPKLFKQMWSEGKAQFLPFIITVVTIVLTDLLTGILVGLCVAIGFILYSNFRRPMRQVMETHAWGDVLRIELSNQVSFLNRAILSRTLNELPRGGHVLLDASSTDYIDPDIIDLIHDFKTKTAPVHGVSISLKGFQDKYDFSEQIEYMDYSTRELQQGVTPLDVLRFLREGNERFRKGERMSRDFRRQLDGTAVAQNPLGVILSCIDSRTPAEHVFDLGLGDVFTVRIAGNVARDKVLGSMEYSCVAAGARLVLVLGHTSCGAVTAAVDLFGSDKPAAEVTGCDHLGVLVNYIQNSVNPQLLERIRASGSDSEKKEFIDSVARANVVRTMTLIREESRSLNKLEQEGRIAIVGGMYDISTGEVEFFQTSGDEVVEIDLGNSKF